MSKTDNRLEILRGLANQLGFEMNDYDLLDRALTHASAVGESGTEREDYESLEFLGDAVLGLVTADYLVANAPGYGPGTYSPMRASVVEKKALARVATKLNIAPAIRLGKGEETSGGRGRDGLLSDCMEAIIAALYLDKGYHEASAFVCRVFSDELERALSTKGVLDYRSQLQNKCQVEQIPLPEFIVVRSSGPDHKKEFDVEVRVRGKVAGRGTGSTKKDAEQDAARAALEHEGKV
jgi:ribonuclease-3